MSEHSDYDANLSHTRKRIDDDDDFSFLNNLVLDTSGEATVEEIIEALGDDDATAMVGPHGATAALEPTLRSTEPGVLLNPPPPYDRQQVPSDEDLDDFSSIIGDEPERELDEADRALLASLDDVTVETAELQPAPGSPQKPDLEPPAPELTAHIRDDDDRGQSSDEVDNIVSRRRDNERDKRSVLPAGIDETPARAKAFKAQVEPQPAPDLDAPQQPDLAAHMPDHPTALDTLSDDEVDAVVALDDGYRRSAVVYVEPTPPSKFAGCPTVTDPKKLASLHKQAEMLRDYAAKRELRRREQLAKWCNLLDQARARIDARKREAKELARRERDVVRKQNDRDAQIPGRRIEVLDQACANPRGDHFLVKLRGRSEELEAFRQAMATARASHGPKASLAEIASSYMCATGRQMTKNQARNRVKIINELEAPGGLWHRWIAS